MWLRSVQLTKVRRPRPVFEPRPTVFREWSSRHRQYTRTSLADPSQASHCTVAVARLQLLCSPHAGQVEYPSRILLLWNLHVRRCRNVLWSSRSTWLASQHGILFTNCTDMGSTRDDRTPRLTKCSSTASRPESSGVTRQGLNWPRRRCVLLGRRKRISCTRRRSGHRARQSWFLPLVSVMNKECRLYLCSKQRLSKRWIWSELQTTRGSLATVLRPWDSRG